MSDIALHTFTLGDVPPRVHGVKVFRRESVVEELLLEMDLSWTGNQKFQLQARAELSFFLLLFSGLVRVCGGMCMHLPAAWLGTARLSWTGNTRFQLQARAPSCSCPPLAFLHAIANTRGGCAPCSCLCGVHGTAARACSAGAHPSPGLWRHHCTSC
jgi:hypothetical protein